MIVIGTILLIAGIGSTIMGFYMNNSLEAQMNALFSSGNVDPGTPWIIAGVGALIVGLILLIIGLTRRGSRPKPEPAPEELSGICLHCGKRIPRSAVYCPSCGKSTSPVRKETVCPFCENILPEGASVCPACGNRVGRKASDIAGEKTVVSGKLGGFEGWRAPDDSDL